MGLAIFKRAQRLQGGTEAVPSELPTPPAVPDTRGDVVRKWLFDQVRQGVLPDEALAEIKRDPTSLRALLAYGEGAMAAGTLFSGGEGGGRLPKGELPLPKGVKLHPAANEIRKAVDRYDFDEQHAGASDLARDLEGIDKLPKPLAKALREYQDVVTEDQTMWGERSGEPELYGDKLYKLATQHAAPPIEEPPQQYKRGTTSVAKGYGPRHMLNAQEGYVE